MKALLITYSVWIQISFSFQGQIDKVDGFDTDLSWWLLREEGPLLSCVSEKNDQRYKAFVEFVSRLRKWFCAF